MQKNVQKPMQKHVQKHVQKPKQKHVQIFLASNCDKPLIKKFVRRKILHETVIRLQNVATGSYHSFMQI